MLHKFKDNKLYFKDNRLCSTKWLKKQKVQIFTLVFNLDKFGFYMNWYKRPFARDFQMSKKTRPNQRLQVANFATVQDYYPNQCSRFFFIYKNKFRTVGVQVYCPINLIESNTTIVNISVNFSTYNRLCNSIIIFKNSFTFCRLRWY